MNDKKIKLWLSLFIVSLALVGAAASYFAQKKVLYRGSEAQNDLYTSFLNAELPEFGAQISNAFAPQTNNAQAPLTNEELKSIIGSSFKNAAVNQQVSSSPMRKDAEANATAPLSPVSSICEENQAPIIKDSKIIACQ